FARSGRSLHASSRSLFSPTQLMAVSRGGYSSPERIGSDRLCADQAKIFSGPCGHSPGDATNPPQMRCSGEHETGASVGTQYLPGHFRPGLIVERFTCAVQRNDIVDVDFL